MPLAPSLTAAEAREEEITNRTNRTNHTNKRKPKGDSCHWSIRGIRDLFVPFVVRILPWGVTCVIIAVEPVWR